MRAVDCFNYMAAEEAINLGNVLPSGVKKLFDKEGASAEDLLEYLYRDCRMPMKTVAEWADRLEMEDLVRDLITRGRIQFEDAKACYRENRNPTVDDLGASVLCKRGTLRKAPVRAGWDRWERILSCQQGRPLRPRLAGMKPAADRAR